MNDARIIESLGIYNIRIAEATNDCANSNRITVSFNQRLRVAYKVDQLDRDSALGTIVGDTGYYCGQIFHIFGVRGVAEAWPEMQRRALAYLGVEKELQEILKKETP